MFTSGSCLLCVWFFFFKQKTAYEMLRSLVGSEMCIRDRLNLGNATGHPSFVMSNSFTNQTIAQVELFTKNSEYDAKVYVLPKHLDEKVARLHLDALGVRLTRLTSEQSAYIDVPVAGPFKSDAYRY